jgi:hypothetical protein
MLTTGLTAIPPGGLGQKIKIKFSNILHGGSFADRAESLGLYANTCKLELNIPCLVEYEAMMEAFAAVLQFDEDVIGCGFLWWAVMSRFHRLLF